MITCRTIDCSDVFCTPNHPQVSVMSADDISSRAPAAHAHISQHKLLKQHMDLFNAPHCDGQLSLIERSR